MSVDLHEYKHLEITNSKYKVKLDDIKLFTEELWEKPIHTYFTDHGIAHSERILYYYNLILQNIQEGYVLNELERFVLVAAAYLHDIGMQMPEMSGLEKKENYSIEEKNLIRDNHHISSCEAIKENFKDLIDKDSLIVELIAIVSLHHRIKGGDIKLLKDKTIDGKTVRMDLLASLLRFCDELDADKQRIDFNSVEFISLDKQTKFHWYSHKFMNGIRINDGIITMSYGVPQNCKSERALFQLLNHSAETIQNRLDNVYFHLYQNHIRLYYKLNIEIASYEMQDNLPEDLVEYIEHQEEDVKFTYEFHNSTLSLCNPLRDESFLYKGSELYFAVGKCFSVGCIDAHGNKEEVWMNNKKYISSSALLKLRPDYALRCITPFAKKINIHLQKSPNIDCFIGIYFLRKLILFGKLDDFCDQLLDYCEASLKGDIPIITSKGYSLNMLFYALYNKKYDDRKDKTYQIIERAQDLISECEKACQQMMVPLADLNLKEYTNKFDEEYRILENDYKKFLLDKQNYFVDNNGNYKRICENVEIRLRSNKVDIAENIHINALIWNTVPSCELHWQWARAEENEVLTFVPTVLDKVINIKEFGQLFISRYYISLGGSSKYTLSGLAELLDEEEKLRLRDRLGEKMQSWRNPKQEHNINIAIEDKWNCPSNHNHTMVASPQRGSLLKLEQVLEVFHKYLEMLT